MYTFRNDLNGLIVFYHKGGNFNENKRNNESANRNKANL